MLDVSDTIAAIAVPLAGAARGIVRTSGPRALETVECCFASSHGVMLRECRLAVVVPGELRVALADRTDNCLSCDAYVWPGSASYTRQPTVELHTFGSPPLLQAALRTLCEHGARLAEPGEFTLRAFLAGRLDLTQAEAVLGVIDARSAGALQTALRQLAGGLALPLAALRASLIDLLADLEADLDFVEEDIEFVARDEVLRRVDDAAGEVQALIDRLARRGEAGATPRVVLVGPPNSGKSSLFNALLQRYGTGASPQALVSSVAGTTRDYLTARLDLSGVGCELVDTAGIDESVSRDSIPAAAQEMSLEQALRADLLVHCVDATGIAAEVPIADPVGITILTKCDRGDHSTACHLSTSATTGGGLSELAAELRRRAIELTSEENTGLVAATSSRCKESLHSAYTGLVRTRHLISESAGEELLAAELRDVLHHLGHVVGAVYTDDILDQIFGRFCIGK